MNKLQWAISVQMSRFDGDDIVQLSWYGANDGKSAIFRGTFVRLSRRWLRRAWTSCSFSIIFAILLGARHTFWVPLHDIVVLQVRTLPQWSALWTFVTAVSCTLCVVCSSEYLRRRGRSLYVSDLSPTAQPIQAFRQPADGEASSCPSSALRGICGDYRGGVYDYCPVIIAGYGTND